MAAFLFALWTDVRTLTGVRHCTAGKTASSGKEEREAAEGRLEVRTHCASSALITAAFHVGHGYSYSYIVTVNHSSFNIAHV